MSRTFAIEIGLSGIPNELRPNMMTMVSIQDELLPDAVVVKSNYVQKDALGNAYIMLADGPKGAMKARKQVVKTGLSYGDRIVITEGLDGSEQYIESGYQEVTDGQPLLF